MRAYNVLPAESPLAGRPPGQEDGNYRNQNGEGTATLIFWLTLAGIYLFWDYFAIKNKTVSKIIEPANIRTNIYNLFVIGFAAVIFINGFKVILSKVGELNIPGVSWIARKIFPLFQLN